MKKIVIIGGGSAGSTAAAKLSRLDVNSQISMYEKSGHVSYSNCGLPYYFSGEVDKIESLIANTPKIFKTKYGVDAYVKHEVIKVDIDTKTIDVKNLDTNEIFKKEYDELIITSGTKAILPNIEGVEEANNIFSLKNVDDVYAIEKYIQKNKINDIVVVGGGFIGLEIAENFKKRGIKNITIVEFQDQLFNNLDKDFAAFGHKLLKEKGLNIILKKSVTKIQSKGKEVILNDGTIIKSDIIFMTVGVKVDFSLFKNTGLKIWNDRAIEVDEYQKTNLDNVWAAGDICTSKDMFGNTVQSILATPANRQAVVIANNIYNIKDEYKVSQMTNALTMFDMVFSSVGYSEKQLKDKKISYHKVITSRPNKLLILGGQPVYLKLLFDSKGTILGSQAVGPISSEKRISYIAIAMYAKQKVYDLVEYQFAYTPTVDTANDSVNMAGRMARLVLTKQVKYVNVEDVDNLISKDYEVLDVRNPEEIIADGRIDGSINIPIDELRSRINELDKNKKYIVHCKIGLRAYNAGMVLINNGFKDVQIMHGSWDFYKIYKDYSNI